jgi:hypothetical protein
MFHLPLPIFLLPLVLCAVGAGADDWAGYLPGQSGALAAASTHTAQQPVPAGGQALGTGGGAGVIVDPLVRTLYQAYLYQGSPAGPISPDQFSRAYAATGGFTHPSFGRIAYPRVTAPPGTSYVDYYGQVHTLDGRSSNRVNSGEAFYAAPAGAP